MKTTIDLDNYRITIAQDDSPDNPFEINDCEPPLLTYYGGRHEYFKAYKGAPETWGEILSLLPISCFARGKRVDFLREFAPGVSMREIIEETKVYGGGFDTSPSAIREVLCRLLGERLGNKPEGWSDAQAWMETAESLLKLAGIPCLYTQSNGYYGGDSTLCLVILTPEWYKLTGTEPGGDDTAIMQSAVDLYSAWAWGDVYGIQSIVPISEDEDGNEIEGEEIDDASCWGFYGSDHEASGLMDHTRTAIECHKERMAKEAQESAYWQERGVVTV